MDSLLIIVYIISSVSFIIGLKMLAHPETARQGNWVAAGGMGLAILGTIFLYQNEQGAFLHNKVWIFAGLLVGGAIGTVSAKKVQMTAMPEMVSLFNGMGGACAALISIAEFNHFASTDFTFQIHEAYQNADSIDEATLVLPVRMGIMVTVLIGLIIGSVSFAGSIIAWGKLNGKIPDKVFKGQHIVNLVILGLIVVLGATLLYNIYAQFVVSSGDIGTLSAVNLFNKIRIRLPLSVFVLFYIILLLALAYGVMFVLPIGGADMPVVISLLNSFTGVAAACGGFLYENNAMMTGGILVGAAGTLLTIMMCKAMNRSLKNVLIGAFGGSTVAAASGAEEQGSFKEISLADAAVVLGYANKVMIVPGYGLAVAQAQHACHELEKLLVERGVDVKYAIHPVAGRMPGHMNVLLAESDVAYEKLEEMEVANEAFPTTDVVLILGANDVVNPAAKTDPASPIYGMPILDVELAKTVIVNKRSMKPGYAGIENDLFFRPKTSMLFGDAKKVLQDLIAEIKNI
ncbi:NAD(P) transhydrogenase subunit beta [Cnuella takakiae]|uniref:NAD(P) transhydrogenase subunit beta n=1 Tax=Cnuella takakiae TaxID=1302690 RepID=A0A1M5B2A3_9BACT|nr:NAD(P)(+) transhydrogenase (Re/Si-specific) subunit beta [Cnuella takakiae]OLY93305.1 NAD(P) transhydrogenase subunit beta [Cnuella takakiae]SHF36598.1 NAD(P) transhydrogenase subunit beta [Cnuella takakiae]